MPRPKSSKKSEPCTRHMPPSVRNDAQSGPRKDDDMTDANKLKEFYQDEPRRRNLATALFIAMTVLAMGGPFLIAIILRGGQNTGWPPDRTVEWVAFAGITTLVLLLM